MFPAPSLGSRTKGIWSRKVAAHVEVETALPRISDVAGHCGMWEL